MKKSDLSRFVEDAVRRRMFERRVQGLKDRNEDLPPEKLEAALDEGVREVRKERKRRRR